MNLNRNFSLKLFYLLIKMIYSIFSNKNLFKIHSLILLTKIKNKIK